MKNRLWMVIGGVLAVLAAVLVKVYIQEQVAAIRRELSVGHEPTPVVVAAVDIPPQTLIQPGMVEQAVKSADAVEPQALTDPEAAMGGKVALVQIVKGEQILASKLGRMEEADTLSGKTPPGKRGVTMSVDEITGVGGFIHPGDYVDILGIFQLPTAAGGQSTVTVTLLQHVLVLAAGQRFNPSQPETGTPANNITLALTPQETELVLFARRAGDLQFSLRPRVDSAVVEGLQPMTSDVLAAFLFGPQVVQAPPEPEAPPARQVEIYRGLEKEVVMVPGAAQLSEALPDALPEEPAAAPANEAAAP